MPLTLSIPDDDVKYCIASAQAELITVLEEHKEDVLKEAGRLEMRNRAIARKAPEITRENIRDAAIFMRKGAAPPQKPMWVVALEVLGWMFSLLAGYTITLVNGPWGIPLFLATIVPAIFFIVVLALRK